MNTLLFEESNLLGKILVFSLLVAILYEAYNLVIIIGILLLCMIIFYRYGGEITEDIPDNVMLSPASGFVTRITEKDGYLYISIFLTFFDRHYQLYPMNGQVIKQVYDDTGKFAIVNDAHKSQDNEKKITWLKSNYKNTVVKITQIAGFFPRRISTVDKLGKNVKAGEYLGMIKFGSRVDLLFKISDKKYKTNIKENSYVNVGQKILEFINISN